MNSWLDIEARFRDVGKKDPDVRLYVSRNEFGEEYRLVGDTRSPNYGTEKHCSAIMHMSHSSGSKGSVCFETTCPLCQKHSRFRLLEANVGSSYEVILLGVICDECDFELLTSDADELSRLFEACAIFSRVEDGDITQQVGEDELSEVGLETLARLKEEARTWVCRQCKESVPMAMSECWQCQFQRDLGEIENAEPGATDNPGHAHLSLRSLFEFARTQPGV